MRLTDYRLSFAVAALVTSAAIVTSASAQTRPGTMPIDLSEAKAKEEARFTAIDTDGDGLVSADEFAAADPRHLFTGLGQGAQSGEREARQRGERRGERRDRARAIKDRRQAKHDERKRTARREAFETADIDDDGQLSTEEYENMPAAVDAERRREMFARLDANGDGSLVPDEFPSVVTRLEMLDADGDGLVTRDERRAGRSR